MSDFGKAGSTLMFVDGKQKLMQLSMIAGEEDGSECSETNAPDGRLTAS